MGDVADALARALDDRVGDLLDQLRHGVVVDPGVVQLDLDYGHIDLPFVRRSTTNQRSTCNRPASAPSTRSRSGSATWSRGTGDSASRNAHPSEDRNECSTPRLTATTSPAEIVRVSSPTVISIDPSSIHISCSVCSCE